MKDFERINRICSKLERVWSITPSRRLIDIIADIKGLADDTRVEQDLEIKLSEFHEYKGCE